jgi:hypothetical protein
VFGLMEYGYRTVLVLVLASEAIATVSLVAFLILVARERRATSRRLVLALLRPTRSLARQTDQRLRWSRRRRFS